MKTFLSFIAAFLLLTPGYINAQGVPEKATDISPLLIGETVPDVMLKSATAKEEKLLSVLSEKPTVLIFYRGGWCPYCNTHLAELQGIENEILSLGYQIIAISPDSPENLKSSLDKLELNYTLFSDADMKAANAFGIAFAVSESSKAHLDKASGGVNPGQLPVPAVFVLNQKGEILFEYINPDYKIRLKASLLMAVLKELT